MSQKALSVWLKMILIGMALCGLVVYGYAVPFGGNELLGPVSDMAGGLIYVWITAIPCYAVLIFGWRIATNIGKDNSFCQENANCLKWIAFLAAADTIILFVGNIVLLLINMSTPVIIFGSFIICFVGISISVAAAALSHLVLKAAVLQEQSELTI
ncbi:MAG: DUF2975 domain-containing protein [Lachnospira sp.]|nr:DUF2975 domain-containing protein [Lachnospira sp.]